MRMYENYAYENYVHGTVRKVFKPNVRGRTKPTKQAVINQFSSSTNPTTFYSTVKVKSSRIRQVKKPFSSSPNPKANNFRPNPNLATQFTIRLMNR